MVSNGFLAALEATAQRFDERANQRAEAKRAIAEEGVLHADSPERVEKRLSRLNASWTLARALEETPSETTGGRSLSDAIAPESFGAEVLGLERLMGRNDLIDVGFLERGHLASRSVGRITVRSLDGGLEYGTGFLISPGVLMTNNHVLPSSEEASDAYIEFDYQAGLDGLPLTPVPFELEPERFFVTDEALDFSVVAVRPESTAGASLTEFGFLRLIEQEGKLILGELVNVIQHPNGEPKQLALRENEVVDVLDHFVHYETDTSPGSSGSPVCNDQWEVVALHHMGVPSRDETGAYLTVDGGRWTPDMGEMRLAWKANEGVRVSRIVSALQERDLAGEAAELRSELFEAAAGPVAGLGGTASEAAAPRFLGAGHLSGAAQSWTLPLRITVSADSAPAVSGAVAPPADRAPETDARPADPGLTPELRAALVALEVGRARPYHDEGADAEAREEYYGEVDAGDDPKTLLRRLTELLERTHDPKPRYRPMELVYPWVDLHPDRKLRSIYSGKTFEPTDFIEDDTRTEAARTTQLLELTSRERALGGPELAAEVAALEAKLPYNCEHVVPQSSFGEEEPMKGDLHHLFACESGCNSFRRNTPYFDFPDFEEKVREDCGYVEPGRFEPSSGKGAVARATMYFLLRYPGLLGDRDAELQVERLPILRDWHKQEKVGEWERHRNAAVAEIQGNRNPLIDHPEWAECIPFEAAFG